MDVEPKRENAYGLAPTTRPRVRSVARRTTPGWSKRSRRIKKKALARVPFSLVFYFYFVVADCFLQTGETLRLNRPRPRGHATPATQ